MINGPRVRQLAATANVCQTRLIVFIALIGQYTEIDTHWIATCK